MNSRIYFHFIFNSYCNISDYSSKSKSRLDSQGPMAQQMFNKIIGKKDKGLDIFNIPQKTYSSDPKKISRMEKKDLLDLLDFMEKHVNTLTQKLQEGRKQYEKCLDRIEQKQQKLNVINSRITMISNQHEQLQVKLFNIQDSLQMMTKQKQNIFKNQIQFIEAKQLSKEKITDLNGIIRFYRDQMSLTQKIAHQNKMLKQKYSQLESDYVSLSEKLSDFQMNGKSRSNQEDLLKLSTKSREETEADEDKNQLNKLMLILQSKEQMISLLNKKVSEQKEVANDYHQSLDEVTHELEKIRGQFKQKEQYIFRLQADMEQYRGKLTKLTSQKENIKDREIQMGDRLRKNEFEMQKITKQLQEAMKLIKLKQEEKRILIGSQTDTLLSSESTSKHFELQKANLQFQIQMRKQQGEDLKSKIQFLERYKGEMEKDLVELRFKQKQATKLKQQIEQLNRAGKELQKKLENSEENNEIKIKKLQYSLNQQRIKSQSLKRSLANLETKEEENRKKLDQMYEKKVVQDSKFIKMEAKLKSYKQMIQYLKKEKVEMEKTLEDRLRNKDEYVIQDQTEEDEHRNNQSCQPSEREVIQRDQALFARLNSRIADLQQQIIFLKDENKSLASKRNQLEQSNMEMEHKFKILNKKRQQMMKHLKKNGSLQQKSIPTPDIIYIPNRDKKIIQKALRAFDIFGKSLNTLYKEFLAAHVYDISRQQIKGLQRNINGMIGKCEDMKDIFQGYL